VRRSRSETGARERTKSILLVGLPALLVVAVTLSIIELTAQSGLSAATLDQRVAAGLGISNRPGAWVHCPAAEPEQSGISFFCDVYGMGQPRAVRVTETNSAGALHLQMFPRGAPLPTPPPP
jgi:hypothetical protein